ncbi:MAG TPA: carboxypeptidase-like regulatory domain-containing protein, partial [Chitinophagales bacterium]|nr:carboxypeptidase-like regulatory domain-containing protein [Chitinophagales bacterium]
MKKAFTQTISIILLATIAISSSAQDTLLSSQVINQTKITGTHVLKGTILDIAKNELLYGANVVLKGTTLGATTDEKGYFEITVDDTITNKYLIITYLGYEEKELEIKDWNKELKIGIIEGNSNLDEIVVTSRRRNEEAQEIPIPITVISANQVENSGSFNVNRVKELIPSVQLYSSNPRNTSLNIRGLGTTFG